MTDLDAYTSKVNKELELVDSTESDCPNCDNKMMNVDAYHVREVGFVEFELSCPECNSSKTSTESLEL
ncbi:hypothetical protein [Vibrio crassostreae]|uniref:hypothetical protein n=1 Tax=Vibrio crassostreae TaxID=246167 RepID=UPI001B30AE1E|nr:hypothetical protein [Vibrio crassostreae]